MYAQNEAADQHAPASHSVPTEWEARKTIEKLQNALNGITEAMRGIDQEAWKDSPASGSYLEQFAAAERQIDSAQRASRDLAQRPDQLGTALEIFFRLESLDYLLGAVKEAARKFNPDSQSETFEIKVGESIAVREEYRAYLLDLAKDRDAKLQIFEKEAQRCREIVNTPAATAPARPAARPATVNSPPKAPGPAPAKP